LRRQLKVRREANCGGSARCVDFALDVGLGVPMNLNGRSADFQSAASQGFQPAGRGQVERFRQFPPPADWKSAIQQIGNSEVVE